MNYATKEAGPELNAAVAERIMGWPRRAFDDPLWGHRPYVAELSDGSVHVYPLAGNYWSPSTDPAADRDVLCYVRDNWDEIQCMRFVECLQQLLRSRDPVHCMAAEQYGLEEWLELGQAGDYSRAALMALETT